MSDARELSDEEILDPWRQQDGPDLGPRLLRFARAVIAAAMEKAGLVGERKDGYIRRHGVCEGDIVFSAQNPGSEYSGRGLATLIIHSPKPQRTPEERIATALTYYDKDIRFAQDNEWCGKCHNHFYQFAQMARILRGEE